MDLNLWTPDLCGSCLLVKSEPICLACSLAIWKLLFHTTENTRESQVQME